MEEGLLLLPSDRGSRVTPWLHSSSHVVFLLSWLPASKFFGVPSKYTASLTGSAWPQKELLEVGREDELELLPECRQSLRQQSQ